jgi:hypothetical protein
MFNLSALSQTDCSSRAQLLSHGNSVPEIGMFLVIPFNT